MIDISKLSSIRASIGVIEKGLSSALEKLNPTFFLAYWIVFVQWSQENGLVEFDGDLSTDKSGDKVQVSTKLIWLRDDVTNKLPKGSELKFFRFLYPSISEERDTYRNDPLYRTLSQTIHPKAEKYNGIIYKRKAGGVVKVKKANAIPTHDSNNVALPTAIAEGGEMNYLMSNPIVQAMLYTIAGFEARLKKPSGSLLAYAQSLQVPQGYLDVLREKESEYITRIKAEIKKAKAEKSNVQ